jgi:hypothetical protein
MKSMDWKCGVGVACLLMTVTASPARAQTRSIPEPAGIPVVREGMKVMGSPFSPQYQGAWYQSQANRVAMIAWAEKYEADRQVYLAEMAAKKAEADQMKGAEDAKGKVLWTKVHRPKGLDRNAKISDKAISMPEAVASAKPVAEPMTPVIVESPTKAMPKAEPLPAATNDSWTAAKSTGDKVVTRKVVSETVFELQADGTMVQISPTAKVESANTDTPKVATETAKPKTQR